MVTPQEKVSLLVDQINQIDELISDVVVYKKEVILLRTWLNSLIEALQNRNFEKKMSFEEGELLPLLVKN